MNREQLKDLIEAIAALGIIVTLVFVVLEIRQNTDVARSATVQAMAAQSYDAAMRITENPELRAAYFAGHAGTPNESQRLQLQTFYAAMIRLQLNRFEQIKLGIIDLDLALQLGGRGDAYSSPFFVEYWGEIKQRYSPDFRNYIEHQVMEESVLE